LEFINVMLHLDKYLNLAIQNYGMLTYLILFLIIFCETGFVFTPFLPGDSLIFAAGTFAALGSLNLGLLCLVLSLAAILGDTLNYSIGKFIGKELFTKKRSRFIKKEHLEKTQLFYEKHGGKTIIIARFMPIIRTFAPFVAGIGEMNYLRFIAYNVVGGLSWVILLSTLGYQFGNVPIVKENFTIVIFAIIFISILPGIITILNQKLNFKKVDI
jgi:membrane-associated protein